MSYSYVKEASSVKAKAALGVMNTQTRDWGVADVVELIDRSNPGLTVDEIEELTFEVVAARDTEEYSWLHMIVVEEVLRYLEKTPPPR
jgi:hypothetical protein